MVVRHQTTAESADEFSYIGGKGWSRDVKARSEDNATSAESSKLSHVLHGRGDSQDDVSVSEAGKKERVFRSRRKEASFVFEESTDAESASESEVGK